MLHFQVPDDAGILSARYIEPPFSILNAKSGRWLKRKKHWTDLFAIKEEKGRDAPVYSKKGHHDYVSKKIEQVGNISIFDPVLCELVYRWFTRPDYLVLDPFAGGSVRGIVAVLLDRDYLGIDLSEKQIVANEEQAQNICKEKKPMWVKGDSLKIGKLASIDIKADLIFSCPPYFNLEKYSDDPRDLSNQSWEEFLTTYTAIIHQCVDLLRPDRFACFVIGDVRGPNGFYRGLPNRTIDAFTSAGCGLYNSVVLLTPIATLRLRAGQSFGISRKLGLGHQYMLVFVKGNPRRAADLVKSDIEKVNEKRKKTKEDLEPGPWV